MLLTSPPYVKEQHEGVARKNVFGRQMHTGYMLHKHFFMGTDCDLPKVTLIESISILTEHVQSFGNFITVATQKMLKIVLCGCSCISRDAPQMDHHPLAWFWLSLRNLLVWKNVCRKLYMQRFWNMWPGSFKQVSRCTYTPYKTCLMALFSSSVPLISKTSKIILVQFRPWIVLFQITWSCFWRAINM